MPHGRSRRSMLAELNARARAGFAVAVIGSIVITTGRAAAQSSAPPVASIVPKVDTLHGEVRVDNYFWLREKDNPEVRAYLEAENAYTSAGMRHTEALQEQLYREILGRVKETDESVPYLQNGWWYDTRTEKGKDYPIFVRRRGTVSAPEEIVLDQNARAQGRTYHALGLHGAGSLPFDVSPDGNLLVFQEDTAAFREFTLYVKDLRTGRLVDSIPSMPGRTVSFGTAWADDSRTIFYTTADTARRSDTIWRHVVGEPVAEDAMVVREDDVLNMVYVLRSRSGRYIFVGSFGFTSSEWSVVPTSDPAARPRVIAPRRPNVEYSVEHGEAGFYIYTNDQARNFRVVQAPEATPGPEHWTDWLPHRDSVFIEGIEVFRGYAVVLERARGLRRLRVTDLDRDRTHYVSFPEAAYGVFPGQNVEYDTHNYRFSYSSLVTPSSVYDYDMATGKRELRKQREIPSGFDASKYEVHRLTAVARDGVSIPVSVLAPRGIAHDGRHPLLLYAYGSYGYTTEPTFDSAVLSLVDRGFVYAVAHVRGGQEMGREWYDEGKMLNKMNTFTDFIDVAEMLIRERWTAADRLVANGGSAGGLLMGAVANMRPDLFQAIVAEVPFVDVINTMLDASIPLTAQEWEQWGNPQIPEHYAYMRQYSPYDNVARREYPWLLVTTSLNDSQVMYWEPAKWVAKLRATKTDDNPLYLKTNMGGGHGGSSGRYDAMRETAFRFAFMLDAVRLAPRLTR